tara:strand:+ start:9707 stop:10078 length:372 start_codon:yes stop_codon:yes gene_type:complete
VRKFAFPKTQHLLTPGDFKAVFGTKLSVSNSHVVILAKPNTLDCPRIGFALTRKAVKKAVQRNTIKRIIRESFRLSQDKLPQLDLVVMARKGNVDFDKAALRQGIDRLWPQLVKRYQRSSANC